MHLCASRGKNLHHCWVTESDVITWHRPVHRRHERCDQGRRCGCSSCRTRPATGDLENTRRTDDERLTVDSARCDLAVDVGESHCGTPGTPHLYTTHLYTTTPGTPHLCTSQNTRYTSPVHQSPVHQSQHQVHLTCTPIKTPSTPHLCTSQNTRYTSPVHQSKHQVHLACTPVAAMRCNMGPSNTADVV